MDYYPQTTKLWLIVWYALLASTQATPACFTDYESIAPQTAIEYPLVAGRLQIGAPVPNSQWNQIQPGAAIEARSLPREGSPSGNRYTGKFIGLSETGNIEFLQDYKTTTTFLDSTRLATVVLQKRPKNPGEVLSRDELVKLPEGSAVEMTSVRGTRRRGVIQNGMSTIGIPFLENGNTRAGLYRFADIESIRLIAYGPKQAAEINKNTEIIRDAFNQRSIRNQSLYGDQAATVIVNETSGSIVDIPSVSNYRNPQTHDASGALLRGLVEYQCIINPTDKTIRVATEVPFILSGYSQGVLEQSLRSYLGY